MSTEFNTSESLSTNVKIIDHELPFINYHKTVKAYLQWSVFPLIILKHGDRLQLKEFPDNGKICIFSEIPHFFSLLHSLFARLHHHNFYRINIPLYWRKQLYLLIKWRCYRINKFEQVQCIANYGAQHIPAIWQWVWKTSNNFANFAL